jgi:hypothetical protein
MRLGLIEQGSMLCGLRRFRKPVEIRILLPQEDRWKEKRMAIERSLRIEGEFHSRALWREFTGEAVRAFVLGEV